MDYKSKGILVIKAEHRNGFVDKHFGVIEGADGVRKPVQFNTNPKNLYAEKIG